MSRGHGGDWSSFLAKNRTMPLDFSASINPLGLPEQVRRAVIETLATADRYPDPDCRALTAALSRRLDLCVRQILCGNGVSDLLYRLALALRPGRALVTAPTFSEYAAALSLTGCRVEQFELSPEGGFQIQSDLMDAIRPGLDLVMLCQPNNPTGITAPRPMLEEILRRCERIGTLLAVDESFLALTDRPDRLTLTSLVPSHPRLLLFQSFTKSHAMAGLRLGFALCADRDVLDAMDRAGPPWSVSTVAQAAGLAALDVDLEPVRALLREQRQVLMYGLEALGARVWPGEANYLLFFIPRTDLAGRLEERGILIRDCGDFPGLGPGYYRTAVRTGPENETLLNAMREVLHG